MLSATDTQHRNEIATDSIERDRPGSIVTAKSAADVREVSADLETTPPARPAACQTALSRAQAPYPLP